MNGIDVFLDVLASAGVRYLFGNPGSTELPLNEALARDERLSYIFGLQEIPVVAAADGYALASGSLGVANVHIACGLGNAMGMLYNAYCEGSPLLLTAGQQDRRLLLGEPVLAGELVRVARPWTKWSAEVRRVQDMAGTVRRAIQTALAPPTGPVFLSLPLDVQTEPADDAVREPLHLPDPRIRPPLEALQQAARLLAGASRPAILAGSRVTQSGGVAELAAVAQRLGAPVLSESATSHGRLPMSADHPLYAGVLPLWAPEVRERLAPFDVVLAVGLNVLRLYLHHQPERPLPEHIQLIHLDIDPREIGKNYGVQVGLIGDPRSGLAELDRLLADEMNAEQALAAAQRAAGVAAENAALRRAAAEEVDRQRGRQPMSPLVLMETLARILPGNAAVVEEAPTTHHNLLEKLGALKDPTGHFAHRGWALGWGLGCALGVKLAWPDRPVLALLGDGSALYGVQGLWTAAHHRIPVTFVVCKNLQYRILKDCANLLGLSPAPGRETPGMDLTHPQIDFVSLARAFGVAAHRITEPEELSHRAAEALRSAQPELLEVVIGS